MSFRARVTLAAGAATLVVVIAVSIAVYLLVQRDLQAQIDDSLGARVILAEAEGSSENGDPPALSERPEDDLLQGRKDAVGQLPYGDRYFQVVNRDGEVATSFYPDAPLPVTDDVLAVARGERGPYRYNETVDGTPVRVQVTPMADGQALQTGRSLEELNQSLDQLAVTLAVISTAAVGLALLLGRLVAAAAVSPVHRLSKAAETIARTRDLSHHIDAPAPDELGKLARSFNTMLDALESSLSRQRQLVADASHELRTPLASVRTNVEVLQWADRLDPAERDQLLADIVAQIEALTSLVEDVVELARGEEQEEAFETLSLDQLVGEVVERARRNHPSVEFDLQTQATTIRGAPRRVDRAVTNLVDNAAKWSPPEGRVTIAVAEASVTVADQGPGVDPVDLPHVFDRFYRSTGARSMPGSGLGLAIVKQVAESHGGGVSAELGLEGGASFVLRFPALAP